MHHKILSETGNRADIDLHPQNNLPADLPTNTFDVIVIGSGPAGRALAYRTAKAGLSSAVIESELVGGECPFWACMPSKGLLRPAEAIETARDIGGAKQLITKSADGVVDAQGVFERRDKIVHGYKDDFVVELTRKKECVVIRGFGSVVGKRRVKVVNTSAGQTVELEARQAAVVATGSEPIVPDIPGLDEVQVWANREATSATAAPEHLLIIGGGVVGCEMATFYGRIGKVTLLQSRDGILPKFEPEASKRVGDALISYGVDVRLNTRVQSFHKKEVGFEARLTNGQTVTASTVLLAAGRRPRHTSVGLESVRIKDIYKLDVDDSLCVKGTNWLYAMGDSNSRNMMTHMGEYQARAAALTIIAKSQGQNITPQPWDQFSATADRECVTQVVFTDPQVASAGFTVAQAKARGINVQEVTVPFQFPGAWVHAEFDFDGWAQWVIDVDKELLVGATFVGRGIGDLLHPSTVAIVGNVPIPRLWHAVAAFPTMSEIYSSLLAASGY